MQQEPKKDFFISFNRADRGWAEWVAWQLEEDGYTTVFQAWDFRPGGNFVEEMQRATAGAERTIAVLSPDYLRARFTQPEWQAAFAQDPTGERGLLVPVVVRECQLEGLLPQITHINLVGLSEAAARAALLAGLRRGRAKPEEEPLFPPDATRSVERRPRFPGALPPVWNVPHNRNPHFTGREDFLAALEESLASGRRAALTQAIHGLGGVGKTQLATEYAYRNSHRYEVVWWVRAEEPATLASDYARLAERLGLAEAHEANQGLIVEAVRRWLDQNGGWLLVFDNANRRDDLGGYLPQASTGHVIVTSRDRDWKGVARPLEVRKMPRAESVEFLLKRTSQDDAEAASALAEELGDLPLALEQAGAYVDATAETLGSYLELFREHHARLLSRGTPSTNYPATVATTWDISFAEVRRQSPVSEDLINLCAFFAPDAIPLEVIRAGAEFLPEALAAAVRDPIALDDALAPLLRYALVERRAQTLSIHRLVQSVLREDLKEDERRQWAVRAVRVLNEAFPSGFHDVRLWLTYSALMPHALMVAEYTKEFSEAFALVARILNVLGLYLDDRADFSQAKSVYELSLALLKATGNDNDASIAAVLSNLGLTLRGLGDLDGALDCQQRALEIRTKIYVEDHDEVVLSLNNLGLVMLERGDLADARIQLERAIKLSEATPGREPLMAALAGNLGSVLWKQGDSAGARSWIERAIAIGEATYGKEHPNIAIDMNNLADVLFALGDRDGARNYLELALQTFRKFFGEEHPHTSLLKEKLAGLQSSADDG